MTVPQRSIRLPASNRHPSGNFLFHILPFFLCFYFRFRHFSGKTTILRIIITLYRKRKTWFMTMLCHDAIKPETKSPKSCMSILMIFVQLIRQLWKLSFLYEVISQGPYDMIYRRWLFLRPDQDVRIKTSSKHFSVLLGRFGLLG